MSIYKLKNTFQLLDFAAWTKHYNHGHTNDGNCKNYGYRQLNGNGHKFQLTSGNTKSYYYYGSNERCYWGVYAPGAQKLRFELVDDLDVSKITSKMSIFFTSWIYIYHIYVQIRN